MLKLAKRAQKANKGFTLAELLVALIITVLLGGCVLVAMRIFFDSHSQLDDYARADMEIETAVQRLTREFALIGLGMPNNRRALGSFARLYRVNNMNDWPATAYFGGPDSEWGGPVTISGVTESGAPSEVMPNAQGIYVGPELFYAWAVPTGVKVRPDVPGARAGNGDSLSLEFIDDDGADKLTSMRWDTREIWFEAGSSSAMSGWITLPTLRFPLLAENLNKGTKTLNVRVAPVPDSELGDMRASHTVMALDEIHITQAARLCINNGNLTRLIFDKSLATPVADHLARDVVALQFAYSPANRLLSMFIAVRGREAVQAPRSAITFPSWLPETESARISEENLRFRVVAKTLTWRIRN